MARDEYHVVKAEVAALRAIAYNARVTVERANSVSGAPAVARLEAQGLIQRDPEWTGCLILTENGNARLAYEDGGR